MTAESDQIVMLPSRPNTFKLLYKILVFSCCISVICLWVIIVLTVRLDSAQDLLRPVCEAEVQSLLKRVDSFCGKRERRRLMRGDVRRVLNQEESMESEDVLVKREKMLRNSLIFVKETNQMWCLVPKAASTTWGNLIIKRLSDGASAINVGMRNETVPPQVRLREAYKRIDSVSFGKAVHNESVKKILLVRHPFARLVSAYRDKLESRRARTDGMFFFRSYGVKINRKYRQKNGVRALKQKEPTFEEFIEYLITTDPLEYDEHWQPISIQCGLCDVKYDHIIRQEDLSWMHRYHLGKLGFRLYGNLEHDNSLSGGVANFSNYFQNIPRSKMIKLFYKYQDDFYLFGYKFLNYYLDR